MSAPHLLRHAAMAGIALIAVSVFIPVFSDLDAATLLLSAEPPTDQESHAAFARDWHAQMDALRTWKYPLFDAGMSLLTVTALVFGTLRLSKATTLQGLAPRMTTPTRLWHFFALGGLAWGLAAISYVDLIFRDISRFDAPPWADSPMAAALGLGSFVVALPFFALVGLAAIARAPLPIGLWYWSRKAPLASWFWTLSLGGCACLTTLLFLSACATGAPYLIGSAYLGTYLLLAARAAAIARHSAPETDAAPQ